MKNCQFKKFPQRGTTSNANNFVDKIHTETSGSAVADAITDAISFDGSRRFIKIFLQFNTCPSYIEFDREIPTRPILIS